MASNVSSVRIRDLGYSPGELPTGPKNSILDVQGVQIGQATKIDGNHVRAGVTVIFPRKPEDISIPCYAGMHTLNGNGQVTGSFQIKDWGYTNTPLALTNSCSLGIVYHTLWQHFLSVARARGDSASHMSRNYGTPVVGETSDWWLNSSFDSAIPASLVEEAIRTASTDGGQKTVLEGQHGGGAGMTCHMFPAGTGTSSRVIDGVRNGETEEKKYTVGAICQSNYGYKKFLNIGGVPVGKFLVKEAEEKAQKKLAEQEDSKIGEGSIVIYIFTDAPMLPHQLTRLAQRASIGLAQVGQHNVGRNHSGDIFVALSTYNKVDEQLSGPNPSHAQPRIETNEVTAMKNESVDGIFRAASEAVEEAILNSICAGREGRMSYDGMWLEGLDTERVETFLGKYLIKV